MATEAFFQVLEYFKMAPWRNQKFKQILFASSHF